MPDRRHETSDELTFVIPVRNDAKRLERCLASIRAATGKHRVHVIVGDNGSTDDTPDRARALGAQVAPLPGLHVGAVRDAAAKMATGAYLAFVDSDQEIAPGWIDAAIDVMRDPQVGATGCLSVAPPNPTWVQRVYDALRARPQGQHDVEWLGAGNLVVRAKTFLSLGGFDAKLIACEDVDLCNRMRKAGWRVVSDDRLVNIHYGDPATLSKLFRSEMWRGRNNMRVTFRGPLTFRALPSVLFPMANLAAAVIAALTCIFWPGWGTIWLWASLAVLFGTIALRSARIFSMLRPRSWLDVPRATAVGATYEIARAVALVRHAPHHRGAGR